MEISKEKIIVNLKLDPNTIEYESGFSRDMTNIGHWGTCDIELQIKNGTDLEKAKKLIERAYNEN
jgi:predicted transport protein